VPCRRLVISPKFIIDACPLQAQAEGSGSGGGASADTAYRPKVATWGIFPRPANISRQYGGGRTFKPGEVHPLFHLCPQIAVPRHLDT
jgi:hypothetical protein